MTMGYFDGRPLVSRLTMTLESGWDAGETQHLDARG